ncbi:MAG: PilZ domain-containing protein [Pseudomonadota bacterium]
MTPPLRRPGISIDVTTTHAPDSSVEHDAALVIASVRDLSNLSCVATILTAGLNHLCQRGRVSLPETALTYIPADPPVLGACKRLLEEPEDYHRLIETFDGCLAAFRAAKQLTRITLEEARRNTILLSGDMDDLRDAWRVVCATNATAFPLIERDLDPRFLPPADVRREIAAAAHGAFQLDLSNAPTLPEWAQRRRERRVSMQADAIIKIGTRLASAFVVDAASGGLGLKLSAPLEPGERVTVELSSGRSFRGTIAWRRGMRAGLTFDKPLAPTDELLTPG